MDLDKYKKVGEIHKKIQEEIREFVIPNKKLIEIVKFIEKKLWKKFLLHVKKWNIQQNR